MKTKTDFTGLCNPSALSHVPWVAVCLLMFTVLSTPTQAEESRQAPSSSDAASNSLTVVADPQIQIPASNHGDYDFGWASPIDTSTVEHTFTVRNDGSSPVTISDLTPSCHCTTGEFEPSTGGIGVADEALPVTLLPGLQIAIKMTVRLAGHPSGPLSKFIYVDVQGENDPTTLLEISGTLSSALSFSPSQLDFGTLKLHQSKVLTLTANYDSRLAHDTSALGLICDNPAVSIVAASKPCPVAKDESEPKTGPTIISEVYKITLKNTHPCAVIGTITFQQPQAFADAGVNTIASVRVVGEIVGDASLKKIAARD